MLDENAEMNERELSTEPLTETELDSLIGDRRYLDFLNSKNELYRTMNMKENPPSRGQAVKLMAKNPNLIRRPIVRRGKELILGFDAEKLRTLIK